MKAEPFLLEKTVFSAKIGTQALITAYVTAWPAIWDTKSTFIRAAIARYIEEQRKYGRHVTTQEEEAIQ